MKLTVLGCNGPYPEMGGACSGYLVETEHTRVLLDCGAGVLSKLSDIDSLDAVILSHLHFDHMSDMLPLIYRCQAAGKKLRVYLPMQENPMRDLLTFAYDACDVAQGGQIGDIAFAALPVRHPVSSYAVRLTANGRTLCYSGDTNTCDGLAAFAQNADLFLCDACFTDALWAENKPHLSGRLAAKVAREANAGHLVLTHFTPGSDREQILKEAREEFGAVCLAGSGLTLNV